jgi:hypothetical protein
MDPRPLEQNIETWPLSRIVEYAWTHGANGGFRQFPLAVQGIEVFRRRLLTIRSTSALGAPVRVWILPIKFRPRLFCGRLLATIRPRPPGGAYECALF